jgi:hypothetical protein
MQQPSSHTRSPPDSPFCCSQPLPLRLLQTLGQAAGAVAMGVAATAVFSALAIDVADVAMLGVLGAGSIAAWSTPSPAKRRGSASSGSSSETGAASGAELGTVELGAAAGEAELAPSAEVATPAVPAVDEVQLIGSKGSAPGAPQRGQGRAGLLCCCCCCYIAAPTCSICRMTHFAITQPCPCLCCCCRRHPRRRPAECL